MVKLRRKAKTLRPEDKLPGGRSRKAKPLNPARIRELAEKHTLTAIETLAAICQNDQVPAAARVSAACALLDRAFGKPVQAIDASIEAQTYAVFVPAPIEDVSEWERMSAGLLSGPRSPALN